MKPRTRQVLKECFVLWSHACPKALDATTETDREEIFGKEIGVSGTTVRNWIGRSNSRGDIRESHALAIIKTLSKYAKNNNIRRRTREFIRRYDHDYPERSKENLWLALGEKPRPPLKPTAYPILDLPWLGNSSATLAISILCLAVSGIALSYVPDMRPLLVTIFGLVIVISWLLEDAMKSPQSREALREVIHNEKYADIYRSMLRKVLDSADSLFMAKWQRDSYPDNSKPKAAWTITLFARTLMFASLYPTFFILYQWTVQGTEVEFGSSVLLFDTLVIGKFYISVVFIVSFGLTTMALVHQKYASRGYLFWASVLAVIGAILGSFVFGPPSSQSNILTENAYLTIAIAGILIFYAVLAHFRITEHIVGPTVGLAIAGSVLAITSGAIEDTAAHAASLFGFEALLVDYFLAFTINIMLTVFIGLPLTVCLMRIVNRPGVLAPLIFSVLPVVAIASMSLSVPFIERPDYFIVLGLIPTINAVFDFLSIGLTRWALRNGLANIGVATLLYGALDLLAAILIFLGLGCTFILVFHVMNEISHWVIPSANSAVLNFQQKFAQIGRPDDPYRWIYWSFLTTLIPTLLHATVAIWALGPAILPESIKQLWVVRLGIQPLQLGGQLTIILPIALWSTFSIVIPMLLTFNVIRYLATNSCQLSVPLLEFFVAFYLFVGGEIGSTQFTCT